MVITILQLFHIYVAAVPKPVTTLSVFKFDFIIEQTPVVIGLLEEMYICAISARFINYNI